MFDRVKFKIIIDEPEEVAEKLGLYPKESGRTGGLIFTGPIRNLQVKIIGNYMFITGSLHKFFKENNYSDFSHEEICQSISELSSITGVLAKDMKCTLLEAGFNLIVEHAPADYMRMLIDYRGIPYYAMTPLTTGKKLGGVRCKSVGYEIKLYDKTFDVVTKEKIPSDKRYLIPANLLRYEVTMRSRKVKTLLSSCTAQDLCSLDVISKINDEIQRMFLLSRKKTAFNNYDSFCAKDVRDHLFIISDDFKLYQALIAKRSADEKKCERIRVKKVLAKFETAGVDICKEVESKMKEKYDSLMMVKTTPIC